MRSRRRSVNGKSAIYLARVYGERKRNFTRQHLWARGHIVSTVGRDEAVIREYIRKYEAEDSRLDQLNMWRGYAGYRKLAERGDVRCVLLVLSAAQFLRAGNSLSGTDSPAKRLNTSPRSKEKN